jgi:membrane-associated phospholipid phosphatase
MRGGDHKRKTCFYTVHCSAFSVIVPIYSMKLPLVLTKKNKWAVAWATFIACYCAYYFTNHFPVFQEHLLPMTWVDAHTPFVPYTVFIYTSEYLYFILIYLLMDNYDNANKYLYSYLFLQYFSCAIFFFYPTTYPRGYYPVPSDLPQFVQSSWTWLRTTDAAGNCFPSLHVSSVYIAALAFRAENKPKLFWMFFTWSTLIALSTLTTKQHYGYDIVAGMALSAVFYYAFMVKQEYQRVWGHESATAEVQA